MPKCPLGTILGTKICQIEPLCNIIFSKLKILLWTVDKMMSTHEKSFALTTNVAIDTGQSILTKLIIIFSLSFSQN